MRRSVLLAFLMLGCGGGSDDTGPTNPPPPAAVATVSVTSSAGLALLVGGTSQLVATTRDAGTNVLTGRAITWSSSADAVATVSSSGSVTAVGPGTAIIRATSEGKTGEVNLTVTGVAWALTGSLATGRTLHTATLLANGRVLVTGGQNVSGTFVTYASSELYDPATGTWSATGNMATGRENHVAVRLPNGKVLVVGGYSIEQQARLRSAELYDPATGAWTSAGNMNVARDNPGVALLGDGTVFVSGGSGTGLNLEATATAEIYNPTANTWTAVGNMSVARAAHTAIALGNGRVLVAGGGTGTFAAPQLHTSAELFDPAARTFSATGSFSTARGYHRAVLLQNGRVLAVGGSNFTSTVYGNADLFDASTGTWTPTGAMTAPRLSHTATVLTSGRVLVAGGGNTTPGPLVSAELYDVASGTWSATQPMRVARSNHAAVLLANGKVLVVGGQGTGAATSAELFDPAVVTAIVSGISAAQRAGGVH